MAEPVVVCPATAAACQCKHAPGHEPPHECTDAECNGAWVGDYDSGEGFEAVRLPNANGLGPALEALFFGI